MATTIVIADDFPALRHGARTWLADQTDVQVVGEAKDGSECVRLVNQRQPNLLITDIQMPGLSGLQVLQELREKSPQTHSLIWAPQFEEHSLLEALRKGALGYILKTSSAEVFRRAVRAVAKGNHYLDAAASNEPLDVYLKRAQEEPADQLETLTPREREVLQLVVEGRSSAQVAQHLHISPRTVEQHRARMMRKLRLHTLVELTRFALKRGLISWDD